MLIERVNDAQHLAENQAKAENAEKAGEKEEDDGRRFLISSLSLMMSSFYFSSGHYILASYNGLGIGSVLF